MARRKEARPSLKIINPKKENKDLAEDASTPKELVHLMRAARLTYLIGKRLTKAIPELLAMSSASSADVATAIHVIDTRYCDALNELNSLIGWVKQQK